MVRLSKRNKAMTLDSSYIFIDGLRLHAFHGVMEQERRVGADFLVDIRVQYNISKAIETDDVAHTLNYADLLQIVSQEMARPSSLLEHVAGHIVQAIFETYPSALAVDLKLTKLNPPMGADSDGAGVELHCTR